MVKTEAANQQFTGHYIRFWKVRLKKMNLKLKNILVNP
jgi:hypothetical protein